MKINYKKVLSYIPIVFFGLAIVLILQLGYALANDEVPSIFNRSFLHIKTPSMEDEIMTGDIIVINQNYDTLEVNDIISFKAVVQNREVIITHRIQEVNIANNTYTTKGDNNTSIASWERNIEEEQIIGKYTGAKSSFFGALYDRLFARGINIVFLIIIAAFILIAFIEILNIVNLTQEKKQIKLKNKMIEEAKEKIKKEKDNI
ncbi:MAG: signal peptidase I [Candidatus Izimaplasma sp.]|nr:signal peptidase I [Candidatus Izimaplasma bacterium]